MYPQNDKIGVLDVPEIKTFFATQPVQRLMKDFCKVISPGFTLVVSL